MEDVMKPWHVILQRIFLASAFVLVPVAASHGQSVPASSLRVVLKGHDPVAYFTESKAVMGAKDIAYDWDEARYQFSSARNRQMFSSNPDRYSPQFDGLCATGLATGLKAEADPNVWKIVEGKLYVFSSPQAREMAEKDPNILARSHAAWKASK
jgi:YHS domain-containing protein